MSDTRDVRITYSMTTSARIQQTVLMVKTPDCTPIIFFILQRFPKGTQIFSIEKY